MGGGCSDHATAEFHADDDMQHALGEDVNMTIEQYCFGQACVEALTCIRVHCGFMSQVGAAV